MKKQLTAKIMIIIVLSWVFAARADDIQAQVKDPVEGVVKSTDGKLIKGAKITLIAESDGQTHKLTTDKKGRWRKPRIRPGMWVVEVRAEGYKGESKTVQVYPYGQNLPIIAILSPLQESSFKRGDELFQQEKYKEALQEYQRVLAENPELYLAYERIGLCHSKLDDLDNAIIAFKSMLAKEPKSRESLINLGVVYFQKGEAEEGMKYLNQLDAKSLENPDIFYNVGLILFKKRKIDMAIDYFNKCITIDPKYVDGYYQLALAYLNKADMQEAKKNLEKVIELAPDSEKAAIAKNTLESIK
jgi:tetratricopeptide (TPR) repeat protein